MEMLGCCGNKSFFEDEEIHHLMSPAQSESPASSSAALLELPHPQAVQRLHSSLVPSPVVSQAPIVSHLGGVGFQTEHEHGVFERTASVSVFSGGGLLEAAAWAISTSSGVNLINTAPTIKCEPPEAESLAEQQNDNLTEVIRSSALASDPIEDNAGQPIHKPAKRKEREEKVNNNDSNKKSKSGSKENSEESEKLPYVHVRARRGQATDNHSLAERARREKINARMKLLQDLVPGCSKISGTALVLDEIIHHVQSLQRQVEFLSMKLATVNQILDFNLDSLLASEYGLTRQPYQQQWPLDSLNQPAWVREEDNPNLLTPDLSFNSGNSVSLRPNHVKMES